MLKRIAACLGVLVLVFLSLPKANAQQQGGSGMSISPTRGEFTIAPGNAENMQITLKNTTGIPIIAKVTVDDFEADGNSGEPKILVNSKVELPTNIKKFLVGVEDISLGKEETKKFDIPIQVPVGATAGSYYGVIRYTAQAVDKVEAKDKQVSLNASIGLIVLITVPGNITEQLQAQKIAVARNGSNGSFFVAPPQKANITLKNTGNSFSKPYGRVVVNRGNKEVFHYEINNTDPRGNILPGASRTFTDDIKNIKALGRYTIIANVSYGKGGEIVILKTSFWVLPLWFVIAFSAVLLVVIVTVVISYRRITKKHRHNRR